MRQIREGKLFTPKGLQAGLGWLALVGSGRWVFWVGKLECAGWEGYIEKAIASGWETGPAASPASGRC